MCASALNPLSQMPRASPRLAVLARSFIDDAASAADDDELDADDEDYLDSGEDAHEEADDDVGDETAVEPPLSTKKRGRPRKEKAPAEPFFDKDKDEQDQPEFSLTYGKTGGHMPAIWHTSMSEFLEEYSPRYINSRERGFKNEYLHGQCVCKLPCATDKAALDKVKKEMKRAMGCSDRDGSGCRIELKPLVVGQTFVRMVGYCMKDQGLPHFVMANKNVTAEEIERGIAEHTSLKLNYMDGFIALNRSNLFQRAHTFWSNLHGRPTRGGFC